MSTIPRNLRIVVLLLVIACLAIRMVALVTTCANRWHPAHSHANQPKRTTAARCDCVTAKFYLYRAC